MKRTFAAALLCISLTAQAAVPDSTAIAVDSTMTDTMVIKHSVGLDVFLYSRYVWRGVQFGNGPSVQAQVSYANDGFMAACYVSKSMNGSAMGYPNTSNVMIGYQYNGISLFVDDYYFYDEDNIDRYFDWSDTTLHYIEARLRYDHVRFYGMGSYNVYAGNGANKAPYVEAGYKVPEKGLTFFAGYVFDRSDLNFSTTAGMTNVGMSKQKEVKFSDKFSLPLSATLMVNPNYKNVVDVLGVGRNAMTLVVGAAF